MQLKSMVLWNYKLFEIIIHLIILDSDDGENCCNDIFNEFEMEFDTEVEKELELKRSDMELEMERMKTEQMKYKAEAEKMKMMSKMNNAWNCN